MIEKIVAGLAAFLMLFGGLFAPVPVVPQSGAPLTEAAPTASDTRFAERVEGVAGSVFYIGRPGGNLQTVNGADFGLSPTAKDNFPALEQALAYCKNHPGTRLEFAPGVYYLENRRPLSLQGLRDVLLWGEGVTFVFSNVVEGFVMQGCDGVEFHGISFDWDWEKHPLSDLVKIQNASKKNHTLDLEFMDTSDVDEATVLAAITRCDDEAFTYGAPHDGKELYIYQRPDCIRAVTKTAPNVLHIIHDGAMDRFKNGEFYILRHYVYDRTFFVMKSSSNITFDGISLYGYPGSGFYITEMSSHFQFVNAYIGVAPGQENFRRTSLGSDAIHIVNSNGCFRIENCDISGQGDDALNVHDGLGQIKNIAGDRVTLEGSAMYLRPGDELHFFTENFEKTDCSAVIKSVSFNGSYEVIFNENVEGKLQENMIAYSTAFDSGNYVLRNNYIHENRARGFLLQSSNGLCEGNHFYKTQMQAINVVADISPGLWYEGTGVDRLEIKNNTFENCDVIETGAVLFVSTLLAGKTATAMPFTNVTVTGNRFTEFPGRVLKADNVNGLTFAENDIDAGTEMPASLTSARAYFGAHCANIRFENNTWRHCLLGNVAKTKTLPTWARIHAPK